MFYFNTSFEETVRRHQTRQMQCEFTAEDMRKWYAASHRSHHFLEKIIPESYTVDEAAQFILSETATLTPEQVVDEICKTL